MSSVIDKALTVVPLEEEEEDVPFDMPNLPQYSSNEENVLSLIGRVLNPDGVKMLSLILDLPRK